jgi:tetratricopeptide (TPR) repeat protein
MSRVTVYLVTLLLLHTLPVHADEAMDYFDQARKGSVTRKKIELFTKALELNPKLAAAYEQRGLLYYFQGKYDKVIQDYQTYLDLAPEKAEAYRMLGLGYLKNGDYQPAIAHFTRAIELEPKHPGGYAYRAEANRLSGKDEEADPRWSYWVRYWYKYASLEELSGAGLVGIIVLALVLVFGLKLKAPWKND